MSIIESRIMELQFNNSDFQKNVDESIESLDKLEKALDFDDATDGFDKLERAAKDVDLSPIEKGIDVIKSKFTSFHIAAAAILEDTAVKVANLGRSMVANATIVPIKSGFQEYETQINAVQTILANTSSKGTTLEQVNDALDELNKYADMTIYNFTEMTRNIGTFTAAGVDLDTSVKAIKGFSNLAAASGVNATDAARGMYQLSQALSTGYTMLIDWKSMETAGVGGELFKNSLIETARAHGVAIDKMIANEGSFRDTLKKKWLTNEIMLETLDKFTGDMTEEQLLALGYTKAQTEEILKLGETANHAATKVKTFTQLFETLDEAKQSGWTQSWEILIGDFEEAKTVLTALSDYFSDIYNKQAAARNQLLQNWKDVGGRDRAIEAIKNAWKALLDIVTPIKQAFSEIFPSKNFMQLLILTNQVLKFSYSLRLTKESIDGIHRLAKGIFSVIDAGLYILKRLGTFIGNVFNELLPKSDTNLLSIAGDFGDFLTMISQFIKNGTVFENILAGLEKVLGLVAHAIRNTVTGFSYLFNAFTRADMGAIGDIGNRLIEVNERSVSAAESIKEAFSGLLDKFASLGQSAYSLAEIIRGVVGKIGSAFTDLYRSVSIQGLMDIFISLAQTAMGVGMIDILFRIKEFMEKGNIIGLLTSLGEVMEEMENDFKAKIVFTIAGAIAALAAALLLLSMVPQERVMPLIGAIGVMMSELFGSMAIFLKIMQKDSFSGIIRAGFAMIGLASAVLILSGAMVKLASLDWDQVVRGLTSVGVLLLEITVATEFLTKSRRHKRLMKVAAGLVVLSFAIQELAVAVRYFSEMSWEGLAKGLLGVGGLLAEIAIFLAINKRFKAKLVLKTAASLVILAGAVNLIAIAVQKFGSMEWEQIGKGLAAIGGIFIEMSLWAIAMRNLGSLKLIPIATSMVILGGAMIIFAEALSRFTEFDWEELKRGLAGIAGALTLAVTAFKLLPAKGLVAAGAAINLVAASMIVFAEAISRFTEFSLEEIVRGLFAMGGVLTEVTLALIFMRNTLPGAAAFGVVAVAMNVLYKAFSNFANLSWAQIGMGLISLAAAIGAIVAASVALTPLVGIILGASLAIGAFGAAVFVLGAGLTILNTALITFAAAIASFGAVAVGAFATALSIVPNILNAAGESAKAFMIMLGKMVEGIAEAFRIAAPSIAGAVVEVSTLILEKLNEYSPRWVAAGMELVINLCNGISEHTEPLVDAVLNLLRTLGLTIANKAPELFNIGVEIIDALIDGITQAIQDNMGIPINDMYKAGNEAIAGFIQGIEDKIGEIWDRASAIGKSALESVKKILGIRSPSREFKYLGEYSAEGYAQGLLEGKEIVVDSVEGLMYEALEVAEEDTEKYKSAGEKNAEAYSEGMASKTTLVAGAVDSNVLVAVNQIKEDSDMFYDAGQDAILSFLTGFTDMSADIVERTQEMISKLKAEVSDWIPELTAAALENKDKLNAVRELGEYLEPTVETTNPQLNKIDALMNLLVEHMGRWKDKFVAVGHNIVESFATGFTSNTTISLGQIDNLCQQFLSKFRSYAPLFKAAGNESILHYIAGLVQSPAAFSIAALVGASIDHQLGQINDETLEAYKELGKESMEAVTEGMKDSSSITLGSIDYIMLTMIEELIEWIDKFEETGTYVGERFMEAFVAQMIGASESAQLAGENLGISSLDGVEGITAEFYDEGEEAGEAYAEGLAETKEETKKTIEEITEEAQAIYAASRPAYQQLGVDSVNSIVEGLKKRAKEPPGVMDEIVNTTLGDMRKRYDDWSEVGGYLVEGLTKGIRDHKSSAINAAVDVAVAAYKAACAALQVESPSKKFYQIGRYVDEGFANGISDTAYLVANATTAMSEGSLQAMQDAIDKTAMLSESDFDLQPRITPVLDLSEVDREKGRLDGLFEGRNVAISADAKMANSIARVLGEASTKRDSTSVEPQKQVTEISFTQNNYSPKALSRIDIYRQTKNQISGLKGVFV